MFILATSVFVARKTLLIPKTNISGLGETFLVLATSVFVARRTFLVPRTKILGFWKTFLVLATRIFSIGRTYLVLATSTFVAEASFVFLRASALIAGMSKVFRATSVFVARMSKVFRATSVFVARMSKVFRATSAFVAGMSKVFRATSVFVARNGLVCVLGGFGVLGRVGFRSEAAQELVEVGGQGDAVEGKADEGGGEDGHAVGGWGSLVDDDAPLAFDFAQPAGTELAGHVVVGDATRGLVRDLFELGQAVGPGDAPVPGLGQAEGLLFGWGRGGARGFCKRGLFGGRHGYSVLRSSLRKPSGGVYSRNQPVRWPVRE